MDPKNPSEPASGTELRKSGLRISLGQKLFGFSGFLVAISAVIAVIGNLGTARLTTQLVESTTIASSLRNHLEADMMHEALRGDVLLALRAGSRASAGERTEIENELARHLKHFRSQIEANQQLNLSDAAQRAVNDVVPSMESYMSSARRLVDLAFKDSDAAETEFAGFTESFLALEDKMAEASDRIEAVSQSNEKAGQEAASFARDSLIIVSLLAIGLAGLLSFFLIRQISVPLTGMTSVMRRLADGDFEIVVPSRQRRDEIGDMAAAVQVFKENAIERGRLRAERHEVEQRAAEAAVQREEERREAAEDKAKRETERLEAERKAEQERREVEARAEQDKRQAVRRLADGFEASVMGVVDTVGTASSQLQSTAQSMTAVAEETARQATTVAAASEEASTNVETVAAAADELSNTVAEIGRQVAQSADITGRAVTEADQTNTSVQGLSEAAQKIGEVVGLISDIAEQTNLLALNATIEAARAGEAGKGFAVVASEVKSLATQTAKATEEIGQQIAGMQGVTGDVVKAIEGIGKTIGEVNEIATGIASAVEEQGAATQEIARNVQQAAAGTQEVNTNISGVTQGAAETGESASQVLDAAGQLSKQSQALRREVEKFLAEVRAA
ncbi:MAG: methyl-accepting chemotaxis protein [Rhodospirillales bacterium]|nr:methyl-accepting chemotaxis protein [Rhodospirillales bacterium]